MTETAFTMTERTLRALLAEMAAQKFLIEIGLACGHGAAWLRSKHPKNSRDAKSQ